MHAGADQQKPAAKAKMVAVPFKVPGPIASEGRQGVASAADGQSSHGPTAPSSELTAAGAHPAPASASAVVGKNSLPAALASGNKEGTRHICIVV